MRATSRSIPAITARLAHVIRYIEPAHSAKGTTERMSMADERSFRIVFTGPVSNKQFAHLAHSAFLAAEAAGPEFHAESDGVQSTDELNTEWKKTGDTSPWQ